MTYHPGLRPPLLWQEGSLLSVSNSSVPDQRVAVKLVVVPDPMVP